MVRSARHDIGMMLLIVLVIVTATVAEAVSSGVLGVTDLTPYRSPTTKCLWPNGYFGGQVCERSVVHPMQWASAPTNHSAFTIRTSDTPGSASAFDPTSYVPGQLTPIHIRTNGLAMRWTGLLMYATTEPQKQRNSSSPSAVQNRVGSWVVPEGANYQLHPTAAATVTHMGASVKATHQVFYWNGTKGLGDVTFRILLKWGTQGIGAFYYPTQPLVLHEAAAPALPVMPPLCPAGSSSSSADTNGTSGCTDAKTLFANLQAAAPIVSRILGAPGSTCSATCAQAALTPFCDSVALRGVNTASTLADLAAGVVPCKPQLLAACKLVGPPLLDAKGFCSYPSDSVEETCPPQLQASAQAGKADVCFTASAPTASPLCSCTSHMDRLGKNPFSSSSKVASGEVSKYVADEVSASSSRSSPSLLSLLGCVTALLASSALGARQTSAGSCTATVFVLLMLLGVASVLPAAEAHNWIQSPHRAEKAAMQFPCHQRQGNQPHVQVIGNQTFEIEWSSGHGGQTVQSVYWAIVPESMLGMLTQANYSNILNDYINSADTYAPGNWNVAGYGDNMNGGKADGSTKNGQLNRAKGQLGDKIVLANLIDLKTRGQIAANQPFFTNANLSSTDAAYIPRDPVYIAKSSSADTSPSRPIQQQPLYDYTSMDKRVSYYNPNYPWLEAVHKFSIPFNPVNISFVDRSSMARFAVPGRNGPGNYIAWFSWGGYYDCVDVNVLPGDWNKGVDKEVVNRYGTLPATNSNGASMVIQKMHHCEFTYVSNAVTPAHIIDPVTRNVSQCLAECKAYDIACHNPAPGKASCAGCLSVQVVRAKNARVPQPSIQNIPYVDQFMGAGGLSCGGLTVSDRVSAGCVVNASLKSQQPNAMPVDSKCDQRKLQTDDDDAYVCYGMTTDVRAVTGVDENYQIAVQPEDPIWYSTCYFLNIYGDGGFIGIPPNSDVLVPAWSDASDDCVSCDFQAKMANLSFEQVPNWADAVRDSVNGVWGSKPTAGGGCVNCDVYNNLAASSTQLMVQLNGGDDPKTYSDTTPIGAFARAADNGGSGDSSDASSSASSGGWAGMSTGARIGILAGGGAALVLIVVGLVALAMVAKRKRALSGMQEQESKQQHYVASNNTELTRNPATFNDW